MEHDKNYSGPAPPCPVVCTLVPEALFRMSPEEVEALRPAQGWAQGLIDDLALAPHDPPTAASIDPPGIVTLRGSTPEHFGPRVFGGFVVAQALNAAAQTVVGLTAHSLHATFLSAVIPGPVEWHVETLRDGRSFATREVSAWQDGRRKCKAVVSFHNVEAGDEYQRPMPNVVDPETVVPFIEPGGWDHRDLGPTPIRADGTYESTSRSWRRMIDPMGNAHNQQLICAFISDSTESSFRPHSLGTWGVHTDASIDHAVWFHRPIDVNDWIYLDFEPVLNHGGRAAVRGLFYQHGQLCMSMAQELLIRLL